MQLKRFIKTFLILLIGANINLSAQTLKQTSGWVASFNSIKINQKFGMHFDFQVRSADEFTYVRNILIRPGLTYQFNSKVNGTLGYALILTDRGPSFNHDFLTESRIWEQLIINIPLVNKVNLINRFRLEQRFIGTVANDIYSDRFRYFVRAVIPLKNQKDKFSKGLFLAPQNELFLNLSNKEQLNNHVFDQNRAYLALGYRTSSKVDFELGYLQINSKGAVNNVKNRIMQVAFYTRL